MLGAVLAVVLAGVVSSSAGLMVAIVALALVQIVHQDQLVRLSERLTNEGRDRMRAIERHDAAASSQALITQGALGAVTDRLEGIELAVELARSEMTSTFDAHAGHVLASNERHTAELRDRMAQAYSHRQRLAKQAQSLSSLWSLTNGGPGLPPLSDWTLMPDSAELIFRLVRDLQAEQVVELGSGSSTALLALEAELRGTGQVTAVEHDEEYARLTTELVRQFGVSHRASVVIAPLAPATVDDMSIPWYGIEDGSLPAIIDVLIVDGPPGSTHALARLPAEMLFDRIRPGGMVILDDAERAEEREIADRWLARGDFEAVPVSRTEKGIAVLRRVGT